MNILFLADNFPPEKNAQASRVFERACYWVKWGHAVSVLTCFPNFPEGKLYPGFENKWREVSSLEGVNVIRLKTFIAANSGRVRRVIDFLSYMFVAVLFGSFEKRPDIVVATSPQFFAAVAGWFLSVVHSVPFVMEVSDLWPDSIVAVGAMKANFALRQLEKVELFLYARASRVVVLTPSFKTNLTSRGVPAEKIDVVINGADLSRYAPRERDDEFAASLGLSADNVVIAYLGTLGMAHGLDNVLHAAALTKHPAVRYLLVGPGAHREQLLAKASQMQLSNLVIAPAQPKEKMPSVWSVCNVALVHLRNTPLFKTVIPSKIFEAMAMGLPILLACPSGEATSIIQTEDCGVSVPAEDPAALAAAAESLAAARGEVKKFAVRSLAAAHRYSREKQARDMMLSLGVATGLDSAVPEIAIGAESGV